MVTISIKDPEADRLVRELVLRTGESQVVAVKRAVVERLARLSDDAGDRVRRVERLRLIAADAAPRLVHVPSSDDIGGLLYGELGLPT